LTVSQPAFSGVFFFPDSQGTSGIRKKGAVGLRASTLSSRYTQLSKWSQSTYETTSVHPPRRLTWPLSERCRAFSPRTPEHHVVRGASSFGPQRNGLTRVPCLTNVDVEPRKRFNVYRFTGLAWASSTNIRDELVEDRDGASKRDLRLPHAIVSGPADEPARQANGESAARREGSQ